MELLLITLLGLASVVVLDEQKRNQRRLKLVPIPVEIDASERSQG